MVQLANLMMVTHFAFVVIFVAGGFLALRWRRVLVPHLVSVGWGSLPVDWCPLTEVQNWARVRAGGEELNGSGFMDHYFVGTVFPPAQQALVYTMVGAGIAASWIALWLQSVGDRASAALTGRTVGTAQRGKSSTSRAWETSGSPTRSAPPPRIVCSSCSGFGNSSGSAALYCRCSSRDSTASAR